MAKVWITEYAELAKAASGTGIAAPQEPCVAEQTPLTLSGTSQASAAFNPLTRYLMLTSNSGAFSYTVAETPTATTAMRRLEGTGPWFIGVVPGQKIAVIENP